MLTYIYTDIYIPPGCSAAVAMLLTLDYTSKCVKFFNAVSGQFVRDLVGNGQGSGPGQFGSSLYGDIVVAGTGHNGEAQLYISDLGNYRVMVFDLLTESYVRSIGAGQGSGVGQFSTPRGLAIQSSTSVGGQHVLYVTECNNNRVQVFNAVTGKHIRFIGHGKGSGPGQLYNPLGGPVFLDRDGSRELFVPECGNHRISVFNCTTGAFLRHIGVGIAGTNPGEISNPWGLALSLRGVDSQGGDYLLYVSENKNNRVQCFNARTGAHVRFLGVGELKRPRGLKMYPGTNGRSLLFVSDTDNKRIQVYEV